MKRWKQAVCVLAGLAAMLAVPLYHIEDTQKDKLEKTGEVESLQEGEAVSRQTTAIVYDNRYEKEIKNAKEAKTAIAQEAASQRKSYDNARIQEIESRMEQEYGIFQVTLGELEPEMAEKIAAAFSYMYGKYPVLQGKLTNLTLGNIESGALALTCYRDFISPEEGIYPIVMKHEIVLNAREFLNENRLNNLIRKSVSEGHWVKDMNIEALVVHELGHVLVNEIRMERYGLQDFYYVTETNGESFASYNTDILAKNQTTARELLEHAYENYNQKEPGGMEEACGFISGYAKGLQEDGKASYEEACAEAVADVYLNQEEANGFSIEIMKEIESFLE